MVTSPTSGIIETVPNATSIDTLKKRGFMSLSKFFEQCWGVKNSSGYLTAQRNFTESIAAYSLVTYFLQIKDRHNGNILLDNEGHIVHIDFGFMLSNSPGGNINFESSPFKLTREYVEVMEGEDSECFSYFKMIFIRGFLEARKQLNKVPLLVELMMQGSSMPCFVSGPSSLAALKDRFFPSLSDQECVEQALALVEESVDNWRSVEYDKYQRMANGIL